MVLYQYQALDSKGKKRAGFIESTDEHEAKSRLRDQGLMVSQLSTKVSVSDKQNLKPSVLQIFTMQLSQLVSNGVPLYQSLSSIEEQYRGEPYHRVILSLCDQLKAGKPFSEALAAYPNSFDKLYCSMITAGESAGALDVVLERLSILLAKKNKIRGQITTAMIYPAVLMSVAFLLIGALVGFVVPSMEKLFEGRELNGFTQAVFNFSHLVRDYWWLYIPFLVGGVFFIRWQLKSTAGKLWLQKRLIHIPLVRTLVIEASVARFCRTMGTLQLGGLTMIESLRLAREVIGNVVIEKEIADAETKIIEGSSLSAELMHSKVIPKMVSRMLAVGEESGTIVKMFNKIAEIYEENVEKTIDRIMGYAAPVILILIALVILPILLAVILPMTDLSAFSGQ